MKLVSVLASLVHSWRRRSHFGSQLWDGEAQVALLKKQRGKLPRRGRELGRRRGGITMGPWGERGKRGVGEEIPQW